MPERVKRIIDRHTGEYRPGEDEIQFSKDHTDPLLRGKVFASIHFSFEHPRYAVAAAKKIERLERLPSDLAHSIIAPMREEGGRVVVGEPILVLFARGERAEHFVRGLHVLYQAEHEQ